MHLALPVRKLNGVDGGGLPLELGVAGVLGPLALLDVGERHVGLVVLVGLAREVHGLAHAAVGLAQALALRLRLHHVVLVRLEDRDLAERHLDGAHPFEGLRHLRGVVRAQAVADRHVGLLGPAVAGVLRLGVELLLGDPGGIRPGLLGHGLGHPDLGAAVVVDVLLRLLLRLFPGRLHRAAVRLDGLLHRLEGLPAPALVELRLDHGVALVPFPEKILPDLLEAGQHGLFPRAETRIGRPGQTAATGALPVIPGLAHPDPPLPVLALGHPHLGRVPGRLGDLHLDPLGLCVHPVLVGFLGPGLGRALRGGGQPPRGRLAGRGTCPGEVVRLHGGLGRGGWGYLLRSGPWLRRGRRGGCLFAQEVPCGIPGVLVHEGEGLSLGLVLTAVEAVHGLDAAELQDLPVDGFPDLGVCHAGCGRRLGTGGRLDLLLGGAQVVRDLFLPGLEGRVGDHRRASAGGLLEQGIRGAGLLLLLLPANLLGLGPGLLLFRHDALEHPGGPVPGLELSLLLVFLGLLPLPDRGLGRLGGGRGRGGHGGVCARFRPVLRLHPLAAAQEHAGAAAERRADQTRLEGLADGVLELEVRLVPHVGHQHAHALLGHLGGALEHGLADEPLDDLVAAPAPEEQAVEGEHLQDPVHRGRGDPFGRGHPLDLHRVPAALALHLPLGLEVLGAALDGRRPGKRPGGCGRPDGPLPPAGGLGRLHGAQAREHHGRHVGEVLAQGAGPPPPVPEPLRVIQDGAFLEVPRALEGCGLAQLLPVAHGRLRPGHAQHLQGPGDGLHGGDHAGAEGARRLPQKPALVEIQGGLGLGLGLLRHQGPAGLAPEELVHLRGAGLEGEKFVQKRHEPGPFPRSRRRRRAVPDRCACAAPACSSAA